MMTCHDIVKARDLPDVCCESCHHNAFEHGEPLIPIIENFEEVAYVCCEVARAIDAKKKEEAE